MLNCQQASKLASDRLDTTLPAGQRLALAMHLALCRYCRRFASQLVRLRQLAGQTRVVTEARLSEAARGRIRRALERRDNPS